MGRVFFMHEKQLKKLGSSVSIQFNQMLKNNITCNPTWAAGNRADQRLNRQKTFPSSDIGGRGETKYLFEYAFEYDACILLHTLIRITAPL